MVTRPQRSQEFQTGILQNPGLPELFGTGLAYFFHPGIDGIPFSSKDFFWKLFVQKPIRVFEIMVLFDMIDPKKYRDYIFQNPGIGI